MLGVRQNPTTTEADEYLRATAETMGVGRSFTLTPVGVFFGDGRDGNGCKAAPGEEAQDPYFGGAGPSRRACRECGECMTGCRHGAKNTLNENYLYLAERAGAEIRPMTTVVDVRAVPDPENGAEEGYEVHVAPTDKRRAAKPTVVRARQVVLAAGTYGTQTLLHRVRNGGGLPRMSDKLGALTRTNSEALVGALTFPRPYRRRRKSAAVPDFTRGVAITSSIHPNENTHIENVRYGKGSNTMALMCVPQYRVARRLPKPLAAVLAFLAHPVMVARTATTRHWSERTIIGLVMQTHDNSLSTYLRTRRPGRGLLTARQGHGAPNPVHIPEGAQAARLLAEQIGGLAGTNLGELLGMPLTAHFLGGCPISADPEHGVIDPYHRLHGHPGVCVVDGAAVSANLGVNPSLTITAQAERAMALWPNKGEADPRPAQDADYRRVDAVAPRSPAVPDTAFARLDLSAAH
jgi:cholesterol oxidase